MRATRDEAKAKGWTQFTERFHLPQEAGLLERFKASHASHVKLEEVQDDTLKGEAVNLWIVR